MIAMLGVFYVHFWNKSPTIEFARVSLFFVVSGFLITLILLRSRHEDFSLKVARNFYIRRALRLMPPLILALGAAAAFDMGGIRESLWWHMFQLTNLHVFLTQDWSPWVTAHLWSLNQLEQFYLCWPLVILFLSRRQAIGVTVFMLVLPIALRSGSLGGDGWRGILVAFDPIAAGALLALTIQTGFMRSVLRIRWLAAAALAVILLPLLLGSDYGGSAVYRVSIIPALVVLVGQAWEGFGGLAGVALASRAAGLVSQISYGAYVYHLPLWWIMGYKVDPELFQPGPRTFLIMSAASLLLAAVSWLALERYIAAWKHRFPTRLCRGEPAEREEALDHARQQGAGAAAEREFGPPDNSRV